MINLIIKNQIKRNKLYGNGFGILGIIFLLFGVYIFCKNFFVDHLDWYISSSNSAPSISLGVALIAIYLAIFSGIKMDINSNENFLRIWDKFEDKRIQMFKEIHYKHKYTLLIENCWKCRTYMERALDLNEMANIKQETKEKLYIQAIKLVSESDLPWGKKYPRRRNYIMRKTDIDNVMKVCEYCLFLDLNQEQEEEIWALITYIEGFR